VIKKSDGSRVGEKILPYPLQSEKRRAAMILPTTLPSLGRNRAQKGLRAFFGRFLFPAVVFAAIACSSGWSWAHGSSEKKSDCRIQEKGPFAIHFDVYPAGGLSSLSRFGAYCREIPYTGRFVLVVDLLSVGDLLRKTPVGVDMLREPTKEAVLHAPPAVYPKGIANFEVNLSRGDYTLVVTIPRAVALKAKQEMLSAPFELGPGDLTFNFPLSVGINRSDRAWFLVGAVIFGGTLLVGYLVQLFLRYLRQPTQSLY
jgi:hypothetical protein